MGARSGPTTRTRSATTPSTYDVVTSRAVAALPRLLAWCVPLMAPTGSIVALKGSSAAAEVSDAAADVARHRLKAEAIPVTTHDGADPTWLVVCTR